MFRFFLRMFCNYFHSRVCAHSPLSMNMRGEAAMNVCMLCSCIFGIINSRPPCVPYTSTYVRHSFLSIEANSRNIFGIQAIHLNVGCINIHTYWCVINIKKYNAIHPKAFGERERRLPLNACNTLLTRRPKDADI